MSTFYNNISPEDVQTLDKLSMLLIELRESREALLNKHKVESEEQLLEQIQQGSVSEHPAYEDYLGMKVITQTREAVRKELRDYMLEVEPK